ncbi:D-alanyl-D-alanine dipeptidase [Leptolyngbya sp. FACHB-321]|uniref:M15 family metallopeptidase n=1 Tax=Leptolyngbya sp. FACHB-321 TaxID=2692807 RepID=UPI0016834044|nr:M15 family metallopeptidase [Leptolyngbya sp. FACHB-321]MBD2034981.1 D-alanyl-D-alanine dipeptidase [Leptolyngbya sp. FACHB-321]
MKPYQHVAIVECGEPLLPIPESLFALVSPHPYATVGAPYGEKSPFYLREGVLKHLIEAQALLQKEFPGWRIQVFDAYRPIAVQQYMVDYTFRDVAQSKGLSPDRLTESERESLLELVYEFWAVPSLNPATPPPHSTGGAIDVTLVDEFGQAVAMGSPIDELSPRSYPDHFAASTDFRDRSFHEQRQRLRSIMLTAGFQQHPNEWWHFCLGDQMWAWLTMQANPDAKVTARYGAVGEV